MSRRLQPAISSAVGELAKQTWPDTQQRGRARRKARKQAAFLERKGRTAEEHAAIVAARREAKKP